MGGEDKKKKKKAWRYRDARALKKKYYVEQRNNTARITEIVRNVKFCTEISEKVEGLAKEKKFRLKDEDYFKDSDDELAQAEEEHRTKANAEENEEVFDPLSAFKDEIEADFEDRRAVKRE